MDELEQKIANYELGFHLVSETAEDKLLEKLQEVESLVVSLGGTILNSREPRKQRLSYAIKHQRYVFFGVIDFQSPSEVIEKLSTQLKLNDSLLRFIILKIKEDRKVLRSLKEARPRTRAKTHTPATPDQKQKEEIKSEIIEKQVEEIIGKL